MSARRRARAIGFSRTLGISDAFALGTGLAVGIGIIVLGEVIFRSSGSQAPLVYAVASFLFLPAVLSLIERASVTPRAAGFYQLSSLDGSSGQNFAIGWLSIGPRATRRCWLGWLFLRMRRSGGSSFSIRRKGWSSVVAVRRCGR